MGAVSVLLQSVPKCRCRRCRRGGLPPLGASVAPANSYQALGQGKVGKGWMFILGEAGLTKSCSHAVYSRIMHSVAVQGAGEEVFVPLLLLRMRPSGWHFCWWREECMSKLKYRLQK